jgi:hypothetical protein
MLLVMRQIETLQEVHHDSINGFADYGSTHPSDEGDDMNDLRDVELIVVGLRGLAASKESYS